MCTVAIFRDHMVCKEVFSSAIQYMNPISSCILEPPQFVKEPDRHLTAEMEKVVDIPCQAKGEHHTVVEWMTLLFPIRLGFAQDFFRFGIIQVSPHKVQHAKRLHIPS